METSIDIVPMRSYIAPLEMAPDGLLAFTHLATINWPDGRPGRFYVKVYRSELSLEIINEITGYLLAKACGLPQPPRVGLIQVPMAIFATTDQSTSASNGAPQQEWVWGWASEEFGQNPKTIFNFEQIQGFERMKRELFKWSKLRELISFDDWVANQDRNLGNVTLLGPGRFGIIDHGTVPVDKDWTPADLIIDKDFDNRLLAFLWDENPPLPDARALVLAAKEHPEAYRAIVEELRWWWAECQLDSDRAVTANEFFSERANRGFERIKKRIRLLAA